MSDLARRARASLKFNGHSVEVELANRLESLTYTDVASGESDSVQLTLQNKDKKWMGAWRPQFGDSISGSLNFYYWKSLKAPKQTIELGKLMIDTLHFKGRDSAAQIEALSIPCMSSWRKSKNSKTWEKVTLEEIEKEIAGKYGLGYEYDAPTINIESAEQESETDSSFLYNLAKEYFIGMKVFQKKIILYDRGRWESKEAKKTISISIFEQDDWDVQDSIEGIYTGARASYKSEKSSDELSVYVGSVDEDDENAMTMKINETCDSKEDAGKKAAAQVNAANAEAIVLKGPIYPDPSIVAGITVNVKGLGSYYNGKYFIDKVEIDLSDSGAEQNVTMHKCQPLLSYPPQTASAAAGTAQTESLEDIAKDVIRGVYGNGQDRVEALTAAGYDYDAVQAEVNKLMS